MVAFGGGSSGGGGCGGGGGVGEPVTWSRSVGGFFLSERNTGPG